MSRELRLVQVSTGIMAPAALVTGNAYVMVRRPGCMPFIISRKEWEVAPIAPTPPTNPREE